MPVNLILIGAVVMACFTISLFFIRFWRTTRDRFFLFFAVSFAIEAMSRLMLGLQHLPSEHEPFFYLVRLCSFLLIVIAIIDKNWSRPTRE